jgi:hypothetical protein
MSLIGGRDQFLMSVHGNLDPNQGYGPERRLTSTEALELVQLAEHLAHLHENPIPGSDFRGASRGTLKAIVVDLMDGQMEGVEPFHVDGDAMDILARFAYGSSINLG